MNNEQVAAVFEKIAGLLEIKGDVVFKIRAYQRAAHTIGRLPSELQLMVKEDRSLREIPGIGQAIAEKIQELLTTGRLDYYEDLKSEFPDGILTLMDVPGIGPRTAMRICQDLGITTVEGLEEAILEGKVASLPRLGDKAAENILRHLRSMRTKDQRIPIGKALPVAEEVVRTLREACPGIHYLTLAGSLRRWRETIGDIDIMGTAENPPAVIDAFVKLPIVQEVLVSGPTKGSAIVPPGVQVDLRIVDDRQYGALIQYFTGSQQHNVRLRDYALKNGLSLNEYGITNVKTGQMEEFAEEQGFYARLGLPLIPSELREGVWEIEAAENNSLPVLLEVGDIKGDLHVHSDWSDGRDPLELMVAAAKEKGYEYVALTDHSAGRGIANGLSEERLRSQIKLLREIEQRIGIKVLCGSEMDIRADGTLDYPDELLAELDWVVGSVHSAMGQDSSKMTERIIRAMKNPYVSVIGHPTCRLLGQRDPVQVDMEALFRAAVDTGTAMEINASPNRLDLKDTHVFRARELGVPLVISTDSHTADNLEMMRFGVAVARRGWCEAKHILNTRPLNDFLAFLREKKPQRMKVFNSSA